MRNIVWHGFISPSEFRGYFFSFLFVLMATIFAHVSRAYPEIKDVKRTQLRFDENTEAEYDFGMGAVIYEPHGKV